MVKSKKTYNIDNTKSEKLQHGSGYAEANLVRSRIIRIQYGNLQLASTESLNH